ncbi:MAG: acyl carrier protein [Burkholderiaceae bacterium]|nr:acyl carrier protein [Burkholderiaceae bacterium]
MQTANQLINLLQQTLNLGPRAAAFNENTRLLGALPELDSMGVVALLTAFEERLGLQIEDDEVDGSIFETVGTLLAFVNNKLAR